jgi:hypothetical protein
MAKLTSEQRSSLPSSAFVFPKQRRYPIHDASHARDALARSSGKPEEAAVRAAVKRRFPAMKVGGSSNKKQSLNEMMASDD